MARMLLRTALRRSLSQVRHVRPVPPGTASGTVAEVYSQLERDFGMLAPPVALHSPAPQVLAASWSMLRETLLAAGQADRAAREAVATAVSLENSCPYCAEVHGTALEALTGRRQRGSTAAGWIDSVEDGRIRGIAAWASGSASTGGGRPPLPAVQLAELAGVAVTFHYLNRMVNVFLGDSPLPAEVPAGIRPGVRRLLGAFLRRPAGAVTDPGRSLEPLPAAPLPPDLTWAAASPAVARSLSRAAAAIEAAGTRSVPEPVRALVRDRLARWNGESPELSRAWAEEAVSGLEPDDRAAGRLALLAALASYQVDEAAVGAVRGRGADDRALVELTAWASLAAARRAAARLVGRDTGTPGDQT